MPNRITPCRTDASPGLLTLATAIAVVTGCADGPVKPDPGAVAAAQKEFVLDVEPADAVSPLQWRELQAAPEGEELGPRAAEADRITLVGVIGGMPNPFAEGLEADFPWRAGAAAFFVVDPQVAQEFAEHAGEQGAEHAADCPFCSREAQTKLPAVAAVTFASGDSPLTLDARDAFGLAEGDTVVVRGKPNQVGDLLTVEADGLFVRPKPAP